MITLLTFLKNTLNIFPGLSNTRKKCLKYFKSKIFKKIKNIHKLVKRDFENEWYLHHHHWCHCYTMTTVDSWSHNTADAVVQKPYCRVECKWWLTTMTIRATRWIMERASERPPKSPSLPRHRLSIVDAAVVAIDWRPEIDQQCTADLS